MELEWHKGEFMAKIENVSSLTSKYSLPDGSQKEIDVKSNVSTTENMTTSFLKEKSAEKNFGIPRDEIKITLKLTNNSEYDVENVKIKDIISRGGSFKPLSLTINGVPFEDENPRIGITLSSPISKLGGTAEIAYILFIDAVPREDNVTLTSEITYSVNEVSNLVENSNTVEIQIIKGAIEIVKTASKNAVISGQIVSFDNVITNNGTVKNTNLFFKDELPEGTEFVENSVKVNDVSMPNYNPNTGFNLEELDVNKSIKVSFDVRVL